MDELTAENEAYLRSGFCFEWRTIEGQGLVAVMNQLFTVAIACHMSLNEDECPFYQYRYCYENRVDALAAFNEWDGSEHPPGPWIKRKGVEGDLANPNLPQQPWDPP